MPLSISDILKLKTIAVVGLSRETTKDSHTVAEYLKGHGYKVIPVNPLASELIGEKCYPGLSAIPKSIRIDIVDIFRRSEDVPPIVSEAVARGDAKVIWMQEGIVNEQAASDARRAGMTVVMDRCMRTEHRKLFGRFPPLQK